MPNHFGRIFLLEEKKHLQFSKGRTASMAGSGQGEREAKGKSAKKRGRVCCCQASYRGPQDFF